MTGFLHMRCMICNSETEYFLSKVYAEPPFDDFMRDIGAVDYRQCRHCGFVLSKTHADLPPWRWAELNRLCHQYFEDPASKKKGNQPPYAEQALMLKRLGDSGLVDLTDMIDYAAGYGTLSRMIERDFGIHLPIFDPFVRSGDDSRYISEQNLRSYRTVVNSAMFEHVLQRADLDRVNGLVAPNGCLVVHTVVCESIPDDPDWFYFRPPVHTAFHTNRSMALLMNQWGYRSSIYCPKGKSWVLLRETAVAYERQVDALNRELGSDQFYLKDGFMDYWK